MAILDSIGGVAHFRNKNTPVFRAYPRVLAISSASLVGH